MKIVFEIVFNFMDNDANKRCESYDGQSVGIKLF